MKTFISVEEAWHLISEVLPDPIPQMVPLEEALGRVLIDEVISKEAVPPFANSAMDGFAVQSADLNPAGGTLDLVGEVAAGGWPTSIVRPGTCVQIMTGAPVPKGADAVVPVEWTTKNGRRVSIDRSIPEGKHIRAAGQDLAVGQRVLPAGVRIDAAGIGALATAGWMQVPVSTKPSVAVIATGNELVSDGAPLALGQIRNSNGPTLAARVRDAGGRVYGSLHARDEVRDIERVITQAQEADVLVFSGGVSMGKYDLVREVLDDFGFDALFWKVKQRPGKPLAFGLLNGKPVFGLPGNPVSSSICFEQYVRPSLLSMQGARSHFRTRWLAELASSFPKAPGLKTFARGVAASSPEGRLTVRSTGSQGSNISMSLVDANCLVHLPAEWTEAEPGALVEIEWR